MKKRKNTIEKLKTQIEDKSIDINSFADENFDIFCDSHSQKHKIREGNAFYMVLVGDDEDWSIEGIKCINCNIKDIINGIQTDKDGYVVVIESKIKRKSLNTNKKEIYDFNVWELTEIDESLNN